MPAKFILKNRTRKIKGKVIAWGTAYEAVGPIGSRKIRRKMRQVLIHHINPATIQKALGDALIGMTVWRKRLYTVITSVVVVCMNDAMMTHPCMMCWHPPQIATNHIHKNLRVEIVTGQRDYTYLPFLYIKHFGLTPKLVSVFAPLGPVMHILIDHQHNYGSVNTLKRLASLEISYRLQDRNPKELDIPKTLIKPLLCLRSKVGYQPTSYDFIKEKPCCTPCCCSIHRRWIE